MSIYERFQMSTDRRDGRGARLRSRRTSLRNRPEVEDLEARTVLSSLAPGLAHHAIHALNSGHGPSASGARGVTNDINQLLSASNSGVSAALSNYARLQNRETSSVNFINTSADRLLGSIGNTSGRINGQLASLLAQVTVASATGTTDLGRLANNVLRTLNQATANISSLLNNVQSTQSAIAANLRSLLAVTTTTLSSGVGDVVNVNTAVANDLGTVSNDLVQVLTQMPAGLSRVLADLSSGPGGSANFNQAIADLNSLMATVGSSFGTATIDLGQTLVDTQSSFGAFNTDLQNATSSLFAAQLPVVNDLSTLTNELSVLGTGGAGQLNAQIAAINNTLTVLVVDVAALATDIQLTGAFSSGSRLLQSVSILTTDVTNRLDSLLGS